MAHCFIGVALSLSLPLSPSLSLSLSLSLPLSLSLRSSFPLSLSLSFTLDVLLPLCFSPSLAVSLRCSSSSRPPLKAPSLCLARLCISLPVSLAPSLFSLSLSLSLSRSLSLSLSLSLSHTLTRSPQTYRMPVCHTCDETESSMIPCQPCARSRTSPEHSSTQVKSTEIACAYFGFYPDVGTCYLTGADAVPGLQNVSLQVQDSKVCG